MNIKRILINEITRKGVTAAMSQPMASSPPNHSNAGGYRTSQTPAKVAIPRPPWKRSQTDQL